MKRLSTPLLLALLVFTVCGPRAVRAQTLFFDYVGFDYEDPNPTPATFGEVGSGYVGLGKVPGLFLPLVADTVSNEYTYYFSGLTPISVSSVGPYLIVDYSPGTLAIYEDAKLGGTPATYGTNPPNATAPATFIDGTLFVLGQITGFQFVFNTSDNSGSYDAAFEVTGGSQLVNVPSNQRKGWTFAGATGNALNVPAGYYHQVDGQTFLSEPVPARSSSWGRIKAQYR